MSRQPNKNVSARLNLSISSQNMEYLEKLADLGIHGVTASEVAKHFVEQGVERMLIKQIIRIKQS